MSQKTLPNLLQEMIRVNQAGEFGAKRIYEGMIEHSKPEDKELLKEMLDQELEHLATFNDIMIKNKAFNPDTIGSFSYQIIPGNHDKQKQ